MFKFYKALTFFLRRIILIPPFYAIAKNLAKVCAFLGGIILISPFYAIAQQSDEDQMSFIYEFNMYFDHKAISSQKIRLSLKNNEIDLSPFIEMINKLRESDYANDLRYMEVEIRELNYNEDFIKFCEKSLSENCMEKAKNSLENAFLKIVQEKENQILYPEDYRDIAIYGLSQESNNYMIQDANEILNSECTDNWNERKLSNIILTLHPNRWAELKDKLKYKDKNFLNQVLQKTYDKLKKATFPEQCLDPDNQTHRVCKRVTKELSIKKQRFRYLTELVYGEDILQTTEAEAPCVDCLEGSLPEELSDLNQLFSRLKEHSVCSGPAPGEEKQVTNNGDSYTVRRESDGSFSIPLNLAFSADEDYDGEVPKDQVPNHYKNKVQECLKKANSKMLGPNGEKLNIVIESPSKESACGKEKPKTIKIGPRNYRSYVVKYESNIDCPTITHEVLHLLGLCDEYKETVTGFQVSADTREVKTANIFEKLDNENDKFVLAYDCRVTAENSIMSDQYERWDNVFEEGEFSTSPRKKTESSLLNKAQFNAVLYGDCPSKNELFNECADLAYKTSVMEGNENCLKQKRKCMENNVMGYNKAEELSRIREEIKSTENMKRELLSYRQKTIEKETKLPTELSSWYDNQIQEADSWLKELREELEMVSAWPD